MLTRSELKLKAKLHHYRVELVNVYDGDTLTVDIDLGMCIWLQNQKVRLWRINTPEVRGPEREEGLRVRDFVRELLADKPLLIRTIIDKRGNDGTEKFGRLLGEVLIADGEGEPLNLNQLLLDRGYAEPLSDTGSAVRGLQPRVLPDTIRCPYCGQTRQVDQDSAMVELCPNCLHDTYSLTGAYG